MKLKSIVKYFLFRVINMKGSLAGMLMVVAICLTINDVKGQESQFRPSKTAALEAWDRGNYEAAYEHFNGLLMLYSRDPLYKYYTGACLVSLQRDIPRAVTLLGSAVNSSMNIKSVPDDVWFWYGRALQMNGSFTQASEAYNRFTRIKGRKVSAEYGVQSYLDQCTKGQGVLLREGYGGQSKEHGEPAFAEASAGKAVQKEEGSVLSAQSNTSDIPEEYDSKLEEAVKLQHSADSISRISQWVQKEAEAAPPEKKEEMQQKTGYFDQKAAAKQAEADSIFLSMEQDTGPTQAKTEVREQQAVPQLLSQFEVRPVPAYGSSNPIPVDTGSPAGLVYRIQLAAFRNAVQPSLFKGLYPMYGKKKADTGVTYYYAGLFRTFEDARQALPQVRAAGFADAFVVAMMNDSQVSIERAALLEKEWASKPLITTVPAVQGKESAAMADTLPVGTLMFRAEVMRSKKPVKPEIIEKMQLLAGTRGFDMIKTNDGETVFLIGNFITFESADEYVSLLVRNGYSTARVAAYVGAYEIPVEAAKELLNKLQNDERSAYTGEQQKKP
jgi:tetratricopeptide (TPR) repeat protein